MSTLINLIPKVSPWGQGDGLRGSIDMIPLKIYERTWAQAQEKKAQPNTSPNLTPPSPPPQYKSPRGG